MSRSSIPARTASGDAITIEAHSAASRGGSHGRLLAQLEHNAMLALGLVRATMAALHGVNRSLERAAHLLARSHATIEPGLVASVQRVFDEVAEQVRRANHEGQALLVGGKAAFALDDPWLETSEPLHIELPDLEPSVLAEHGLLELNLRNRPALLPVLQRMNAVRNAVQQGHSALSAVAERLNHELARLDVERENNDAGHKGEQEFQHLVQRVREHVLQSGAGALLVQGEPSSLAAWLVEGTEPHV